MTQRVETEGTLRIRRARRGEADDLTALAARSKGHWAYSAEFLARARSEMTLSADDVADHETWVLEDATGLVIGFYRVVPTEPAALEDLMIEPAAIGVGHGRLLWNHAIATVRSLGATAVELDADPHAVGFYERMGARTIGETESAVIAGRMLPRMRIDLE